MEECRGRVERALAAIAAERDGDPRHEMQLNIALAVSLIFTRGVVPEIGVAGTRALEIAERLGETLASIAFGRFIVFPRRRELLADGPPIKLGDAPSTC